MRARSWWPPVPMARPWCRSSVDRAAVPVITGDRYRNPGRLGAGGVLVVGASSSGVQIADELARSGRDVVLAVGRHTRMPRRYRGMDVFWWLEATGRLARTIDDMPDAAAARREPSLQLTGRVDVDAVESDVDLAALQRRGVRLTGRLHSLDGHLARFGDDAADPDSRRRPAHASRSSTRSTTTSTGPASPARFCHRSVRRRSRRAGIADSARPASRRDRDRRPGHRVPPGHRLGRPAGH